MLDSAATSHTLDSLSIFLTYIFNFYIDLLKSTCAIKKLDLSHKWALALMHPTDAWGQQYLPQQKVTHADKVWPQKQSIL